MTVNKTIIGRNTRVDFIGLATGIPAKIDTGADSSAVWASQISIDETGVLSFVLFGETSEFYTGKTIKTRDFDVAKVRSSSGQTQIRYRTRLVVKIKSRIIKTWFNLSDRSKNRFPVLIGRQTLNNKFLVDVSRYTFPGKQNRSQPYLGELMVKLRQNPAEFHKKYYERS